MSTLTACEADTLPPSHHGWILIIEFEIFLLLPNMINFQYYLQRDCVVRRQQITKLKRLSLSLFQLFDVGNINYETFGKLHEDIHSDSDPLAQVGAGTSFGTVS